MNWSNCSKYETCEDDKKEIMTYCDVGCSNKLRRVQPSDKDLVEELKQRARLTDEEIGYAVLAVAVQDQWCFRGDTLEDNLPSYRAIAEAQINKLLNQPLYFKIEKAVAHQRNLLATGLLNVLRKAGILNSEAEPNGAELVMVAEMIQYADSSENPVLIPDTLRADYLKAAEQIISTAQKRIVREKNEEINKREIYWRDVVDKAVEETKKAVAEEIKSGLEILFPWIKQGVNSDPWDNVWKRWIE